MAPIRNNFLSKISDSMNQISNGVTIPAAIDLHVHFREPGTNKAETISSGSKAALRGGFGLVCDMPNNPGNPTWTMDRLKQKQAIIKKSSYIPIATYAGAQPESDNLDELPIMAQSAIGLKLYGGSTTGNDREYKVGEFEKIVKVWNQVAPAKPIMLHSGKGNLEEFIKLICLKNKHQLHVCHVSKPTDVQIIGRYKQRKARISCGVCPHHFLMTSHDRSSQGWFARMKPPLVHQDQAEELLAMLAGGQIDVIETDHAPHSTESKLAAEIENPEAIDDPSHRTCFGVPGVEFALPLLFYQMARGRISLERIVDATSKKPAEIIGVKLSTMTKVSWQMDEYRIGDKYPKGLSGSGWTPYLNNLAIGIVKKSVIGGKILVEDGKLQSRLPQVANSGSVI